MSGRVGQSARLADGIAVPRESAAAWRKAAGQQAASELLLLLPAAYRWKGAATSISQFCRDRHAFRVGVCVCVCRKVCLSDKSMFCRDKIFLSRQTQTFLPRRVYFCRDDKRRVLSRQKRACRDKSNLVATKKILPLLRRKHVCHGKTLVRDKHTFVATKMMLMAAPAHDSKQALYCCRHCGEQQQQRRRRRRRRRGPRWVGV